MHLRVKEWQPPKYGSLHWDSKLMPSLTNQNVKEEHLAVLVGDRGETKQLGVPAYKPGTDTKSGEIITKLTAKLLDEWHCKDCIVNMVFDTTASNTGHVTTACVSIQEKLKHALLWSGCRHHVGEVILTHIFNDLKIEVSKSPDILLFPCLRKHWELLPYKVDQHQHLSQLDLSLLDEASKELVEEWKASTLETLSQKLDFKRDDYKEFLEMCIVFLGGKSDISFGRPGALHKARWMAKILYAMSSRNTNPSTPSRNH